MPLQEDAPLDPSRVDCLLLCAGRGRRLRPLTDATPKALVPVHGRPLLEEHLRALRSEGIGRVVLVVGYLAEHVERLIGDGSRFGLSVEYVRQEPCLGTGDAVARGLDGVRSDPFLLGSPDLVLDPRERVWRELLSDGAPKLAATRFPNAGSYGRLTVRDVDGQLLVEKITEKDGLATPGWANRGLYLLPRTIQGSLQGLPRSVRGELELTDGINRFVASGGRVRVVPVAHVRSIGTLQDLNALEGGPMPALGLSTPAPWVQALR